MSDIETIVSCRDCGKPLTCEEAHWYEYRCEQCEGEWYERIQDWRAGEPDAELEEMFAVSKPTRH